MSCSSSVDRATRRVTPTRKPIAPVYCSWIGRERRSSPLQSPKGAEEAAGIENKKKGGGEGGVRGEGYGWLELFYGVEYFRNNFLNTLASSSHEIKTSFRLMRRNLNHKHCAVIAT